MQNDLAGDYPELDIQILGVNQFGFAEDNDLMTDGVDIPWLQDIEDEEGGSDAWLRWGVTLRDVVILDADNQVVGTYNLTEHDLEWPPYYDELRQMLIDAAIPEPTTLLLLLAGGLVMLRRSGQRE
jgi:hypothetical protein